MWPTLIFIMKISIGSRKLFSPTVIELSHVLMEAVSHPPTPVDYWSLPIRSLNMLRLHG